MSDSLLEHLEAAKASRLVGVAPNFIATHECPNCGKEYLCPDRYEREFCAPSKGFDFIVKSITCLPCSAQLESEMRSLWLEAHGNEETKGASK